MKTYKKCLSCFKRQAVDVCAISKLDRKRTQAVINAVKAEIRTFSCDQPPIKMAVEIHDLVRSKSGIADPYAEIKKEANRVCRKCVGVLAENMGRSLNLLKTATQLAIAGNIIDCGAYGLREVSEKRLFSVIKEVLSRPLSGDSIDSFDEIISGAKQILYIGDNAGECFFDGPLLDLMPADKLTYVVRAGPVLNDATIEDARAAGIHEKCSIIDTGDNAPGILLDRCSSSFRRAFSRTDVIIAKGQGNYESLSNRQDRIYVFLTKVKCAVLATDIGYPLNSNVIRIHRPVAGVNKDLGKQRKKTEAKAYYA